jgi:hypothetical protein
MLYGSEILWILCDYIVVWGYQQWVAISNKNKKKNNQMLISQLTKLQHTGRPSVSTVCVANNSVSILFYCPKVKNGKKEKQGLLY